MLPKTYPKNDYDKGVWSTTLSNWTEFHQFVHKLLDLPQYIFRGQRRENWLLESTLARELKNHRGDQAEIAASHLRNFRFAIRGRRSHDIKVGTDEDVDSLWALGQHHGLMTPLLDWTKSPYVALFFAMAKTDGLTDTQHRVVYCLNMLRFEEKNQNIANEEIPWGNDPIRFLNPLADDNARLVSQNGLFTWIPDNMDVETWIKAEYNENKDKNLVLLAKVYIPSSDRSACLKALNRMNINYASLFPDLVGASEHTNLMLQIDKY